VVLHIGFISVIRPVFKGDSQTAARRTLERLRSLGEELGFEVYAAPFAATDVETAQRAARELKAQKLDLLLIQHTTFATGDLLAPLLHAAERVGLWALPESSGASGASGPLPLNALCGLNMTLSFLDHPEVAKTGPVKWFYGEVDDSLFKERLVPTLAALRGLRALESACILQIGGTAPAFYGIEELPALDSVAVERRELEDLFGQVAAVPAREAQALASDWAQQEALDAPAEHLERAACIELGLRALAEEVGANALAVRCWPELPERCGAMACASMGRLGDSEIPAACEGDVMGALSMLALQGISGQPAILMDLSDADFQDDTVQVWHCGNAPLHWATRTSGEPSTRLTTHFNRDGVGVVRDMILRPGPATAFRLLSGGRRAVIASGTFTDPEKASFDGVRGWLGGLDWNGMPLDAAAFVSNVLESRIPHHLAFGSGDLTAPLRELCAWLGAPPLPAKAATMVLSS
jgi:L-fucose isomerase-like protein